MLRVMLLAAASATSLAAQSTFEGAISMTLGSESGRSMDVTYMLKDGKLRMEMAGVRGGAGATLILDVEHKQVFTLVPERRIYMVKSLAGELDAAQRARRPSTATVTRTGQKETIAGHECEHVTVTDAGRSSDLCVTSGIGRWTAHSSRRRRALRRWTSTRC